MFKTMLAAVLWALLAQAPAQNPAQPPAPPPATSAISGVVIDGATGEAIENASVSIEGTGSKGLQQTRQITDAKGRFVFVNLLPAQDYMLSAALPGYFSSSFTRGTGVGAPRQQIPVKAGEWVRDLAIKMWRPASITGRVVDERGEPMVGIFVRALKKAPIAGHDQLVNASTATTDDRGVYRIGDLDPGRYVVEVPSVQGATPPPSGAAMPANFAGTMGAYPAEAARTADGRARVYPITFYPAARSVNEAGSIDVQIPDQRTIGDIVLTPAQAFAVRGRLIGMTDGQTLRLMPAGLESLGNGSEASQAPIAADGAFSFEGVPAGSYTLMVGRRVSEMKSTLGRQTGSLPSPKGTQGSSTSVYNTTATPPGLLLQQSQYGSNPRVNGRQASSPTTRVPVAVAGDLDNVIVTLRAGAVMDAVVVFDPSSTSSAPKPSVAQLGFSLESARGDSDLGIVFPTTSPAPPPGSAPDYSVHFDDLGVGDFWLRTRSGTWVIKSIEVGAQDFTTRPFDTTSATSLAGVTVTVTDRSAAVSGAVKEKGSLVLVFPAEQSQWSNFGFNPSRIKTALPDDDGKFTIAQLPAGDYLVIAVPREEQYAWFEPGYLARASIFATRTTLDWGDRKSVSLSIARVPR